MSPRKAKAKRSKVAKPKKPETVKSLVDFKILKKHGFIKFRRELLAWITTTGSGGIGHLQLQHDTINPKVEVIIYRGRSDMWARFSIGRRPLVNNSLFLTLLFKKFPRLFADIPVEE